MLRRIAMLLAVALVVLGCSPGTREPLHLGLNPWPGWEHLHLAQRLGYFEDERVDVRIEQFSSLSDTERAFERHQIDGMTVTLVELLRARAVGGREPRVVCVTDYSAGADVVLARADIADVTALRGRRVGVEPGSLNVYILARALQIAGVPLNAVEMVGLDPLQMESAFAAGEVDAVVCYPPVSARLLARDDVHAVFTSASLPGEVVDVLAFDSETVLKRGHDVAGVLRAFERARRWAAENPDEAARIMGERIGMDAASFRATLESGVALVSLADQAEFLRPGGRVSTTLTAIERMLRTDELAGPVDVSACVDEGPWKRAAGEP